MIGKSLDCHTNTYIFGVYVILLLCVLRSIIKGLSFLIFGILSLFTYMQWGKELRLKLVY